MEGDEGQRQSHSGWWRQSWQEGVQELGLAHMLLHSAPDPSFSPTFPIALRTRDSE